MSVLNFINIRLAVFELKHAEEQTGGWAEGKMDRHYQPLCVHFMEYIGLIALKLEKKLKIIKLL
jgi:hypothetical protein